MFVSANRIPINQEYSDQFEKLFQEEASCIEHMEGIVTFQLLRPAKNNEPYVIIAFWETKQHFRNWTRSIDFRRMRHVLGSLPAAAFGGASTLELHDVSPVIIKYKRTAFKQL